MPGIPEKYMKGFIDCAAFISNPIPRGGNIAPEFVAPAAKLGATYPKFIRGLIGGLLGGEVLEFGAAAYVVGFAAAD